MSLAHSTTNDHRMGDFMKEVRAFGRAAAEGKDSLPMLAVRAAEMSKDGVISTDKDPDGKDDASRIYEAYAEAMSKKAVHDHTAGGLKANISKLRQIIVASAKPTCDFPATLGRVHAAHQDMQAKAKETGIKPKAPYVAYVDAARLQTEQDDDLSDDQIKEVIRRKDPADPTVEKILSRCAKQLEDLISGEKGVKDDHELTEQAFNCIRDRLTALVTARETEETRKKAVALGLIKDEETETPAPVAPHLEQVAA